VIFLINGTLSLNEETGLSPAGVGRGCVPAYDRAPLRDRLPKKPLAVPRLLTRATGSAPIFAIFRILYRRAPATYHSTTQSDSGNLLLPPPGMGRAGHQDPSNRDLCLRWAGGLLPGLPLAATLLYPLPAGGNGSHHSRWEQSELKNSAVTNLLSPPFRG
jgi:hypothetical protein